jgi:uncharacterized protein YneF (UPF0154 family)
MAELKINNQAMGLEENQRITYNQYGFRSAEKSQSNPDAIQGYLDKVFERFLEEQKLDEQGLKDRISRLKAEIQQEKSKKNESNADLFSTKRLKDEKEKEIEELELEKIEIRNGEGETGETTPFIIAAFITLLLTLYLFVFYSSSGYSAFYGIKSGSLGFINPNVFSDAINKGPGVISMIILFPVIFLALGFLIHDSLETNKKRLADKKSPTYSRIIVLLLITLIADAFIGYKISQGVHSNEFNAGLTNDTWQFSRIYSDINFYLVLVLGFVVYVIWGFLLHYVLSHSYLKTTSEKIKLLLENLNNRISEKRKDLSDIVSKIHKINSDIINFDSQIIEKEEDLIGFMNGVIPVNVASLRGSVGEFMGGWQTYTNGALNSKEALNRNNDAIRLQATWITNKVQSLKTEK